MSTLRRLSRDVVASLHQRRAALEVPSMEMLDLPERVVQFGTGAFLRGFVEYFIDEANRRGSFNGRIVAVSSTGSTRDAALNEQDGLFTLAIEGTENAIARQRHRVVGSLSRAISARDDWGAVLAVARDPAISLVVSNTTEVGIALDSADAFDAAPPRSFPAKLTRFLVERARTFDYDARRGLLVLPCELIEHNGTTLRGLVLELARRWALGSRFERWLDESVLFCNTLVDRIVPGLPAATRIDRLESSLGYRDALVTSCEPYALFAIEGSADLHARLGFAAADDRVVVAADIRPYRERKVRVLNGAHTIVASVGLLAGLETVRDACDDDRVGRFLRRVMFDEVVPSVDVPDAEDFAHDVLERFANPYIEHALIDLTLYQAAKMRVRVVPSILAFHERVGRPPASLAFGFAAYLARGDVDEASDTALGDLARSTCGNAALWGTDLAGVHGFSDMVAEHLIRIVRQGVLPALDAHLAEPATT